MHMHRVVIFLTVGLFVASPVRGWAEDAAPGPTFAEIVNKYYKRSPLPDYAIDMPPEVAAARVFKGSEKDLSGVPEDRMALAEAFFDKCASVRESLYDDYGYTDCSCMAVHQSQLPPEEDSVVGDYLKYGRFKTAYQQNRGFSQCYDLNNVYADRLQKMFDATYGNKSLKYPICMTDLMMDKVDAIAAEGNVTMFSYGSWEKYRRDAISTCGEYYRDGTLDAFVDSYSEKRKAWLAPSLEAANGP